MPGTASTTGGKLQKDVPVARGAALTLPPIKASLGGRHQLPFYLAGGSGVGAGGNGGGSRRGGNGAAATGEDKPKKE
jgi:hypothetical protein